MTARGRAGAANISISVSGRTFTVDATDTAARTLRFRGRSLASRDTRIEWAQELAASLGWAVDPTGPVLINSGKRGVSNAGFRLVLWGAAATPANPAVPALSDVTESEQRALHGDR